MSVPVTPPSHLRTSSSSEHAAYIVLQNEPPEKIQSGFPFQPIPTMADFSDQTFEIHEPTLNKQQLFHSAFSNMKQDASTEEIKNDVNLFFDGEISIQELKLKLTPLMKSLDWLIEFKNSLQQAPEIKQSLPQNNLVENPRKVSFPNINHPHYFETSECPSESNAQSDFTVEESSISNWDESDRPDFYGYRDFSSRPGEHHRKPSFPSFKRRPDFSLSETFEPNLHPSQAYDSFRDSEVDFNYRKPNSKVNEHYKTKTQAPSDSLFNLSHAHPSSPTLLETLHKASHPLQSFERNTGGNYSQIGMRGTTSLND